MSEGLQSLVKALRRKVTGHDDRLDDLEAENAELRTEIDQLRDRVGELARVVDTDPEARDYHEMGRDERVYRVRKKLVTLADNQNGRASLNYRDVRDVVFDGHPSDGYAYKLMDLAAKLDGFEYDTFHGEKQIRVNLDGVSDETLLHAVNNTPEGVGV